MVLCENLIFVNTNNHNHKQSIFSHRINSYSRFAAVQVGRRRCSEFVADAGKRKRKWWQSFFLDEEGNWLGLKDDDMLVTEEDLELDLDSNSEAEKFEAWKTRAEAIVDLREAQQDMSNEENRRWEDWLAADSNSSPSSSSSSWEYEYEAVQSSSDIPTETEAEKGLLYSLSDFLLGREDDDMLYEDRVFRYASLNSVTVPPLPSSLFFFLVCVWYNALLALFLLQPGNGMSLYVFLIRCQIAYSTISNVQSSDINIFFAFLFMV